ncbi:MAG: glycosyltransferase family 4 protein [Muribaculaceae bacterium]|nr:glycosyltransferase family 4 protein [Roseburia sp.]MCM1432024.1 glycosyltransferase family 4 protein [Muribaculaceae bacterium]MCM1493723.1 glycosyltransferase family 4 protein [Muribaculaceae bacterium]
MKRALMHASVASMIYQFNMDNIDLLQLLGYQVDVACNFGKANPISGKQIEDFREKLSDKNVNIIETECLRDVFAVGKMIRGYRQLKRLSGKRKYNLVHTQSPIGGAVCRLAFRSARKRGTKVIYTAHGFHFYEGAPKKNWLVYYPVEKWLSRWTDVLITINKEDYGRAKSKFRAKETVYIPGVGIDTEKFAVQSPIKNEKRKELGIPKDKVWLLSVGELTQRKNHETLIRAVADIDNMFLTIAGQGKRREDLENLIDKLEIRDKVSLIGFRADILELCKEADMFVFPSYQEGLPVALMEAMASGLPCVVSRIRGNIDLIDEEKGGYMFDPAKKEELRAALINMSNEDWKLFGDYNRKKIEHFSLYTVKQQMKEIYKEM